MKPGTFTQLYIHLVFAVKNRDCLLHESHRHELFKYISGIVTNREHKSIVVNGMSDHAHILLGLNPKESISNLVRDVKRSSSLFIKKKRWFLGKFTWQEGYGAFSYGRSQLNQIYNYILNQKEHHKKQTFREEYHNLLKKFDIKYDERYLFVFFD